jgi:hypothetical protein
MFEGFSCKFLDLVVAQSLQGLSCDISDKHFQPEYASIEMINIPHVHSNILVIAKLRVINIQFYRFLGLCSCNKFFIFQMVSLIVFLKVKGYPLKFLLKKTRRLHIKEKFMFGISPFGDFVLNVISGEFLVSPLVHDPSMFVFSFNFFFSFSISLCFFCLVLVIVVYY